jgi:hypothetical protein
VARISGRRNQREKIVIPTFIGVRRRKNSAKRP